METERISCHESVVRAYKRIKNDQMTNVWDRLVRLPLDFVSFQRKISTGKLMSPARSLRS